MLAMKLLEEGGPNTELSWLLLIFLGFFFLMVVVGWWVSSRNPEQQEPVHAPAAHPAEPHHEAPAAADDLTILEGIGPRVARVLKEAGITTFAALAAANAMDLQRSLSAAGLQMMNAEGWIEQAALAANGDWEGLKKLQGDLKGGRRKV